jgi:hypothetical protein
MTHTLKQFQITSKGEAYTLVIETEDGSTIEVSTSFEQLDLIAEEIDRVLDRDEESALSEE